MSAVNHYEMAMRRALDIALNGPYHGVNPQVGAVILDQGGQIIAEGWHLGAGTPHAEVMALENLRTALGTQGPKFAAGYTAVVTLEPCNHTGLTGPCSQALIDAGISKVVFAAADPNLKAAGGAATLREAGVEVIDGVLKFDAEDQARVWLGANRMQRPFVTLKWASSLDGRAAAADGTSQWISGPESRAETHLRRSRVDAILVGTQTALADDPELTARRIDGSYYEHQPLRVLMGYRELPDTLKVFNAAAETVHFKTRSIKEVLDGLWARGIKQVWVEGGPTISSDFLKANMADELIVYLAPMLLGGTRTAISDIGVSGMGQARSLDIREVGRLGKDIFIRAAVIGE